MYPFFMSERIGCGFVQPAIGAVDLLSLCINGGGAGPSAPPPSASPASTLPPSASPPSASPPSASASP
jgi:hypothetical protein